MYILHSLPKYSSKIRTVLKKKIAGNALTSDIIDKSLNPRFSMAFRSDFDSIIKLAASFMSSVNDSERLFSGKLYENCFQAFPDLINRQEVVASLLTHCGSNFDLEVTDSLSCIIRLLRNYQQDCQKFKAFFFKFGRLFGRENIRATAKNLPDSFHS